MTDQEIRQGFAALRPLPGAEERIQKRLEADLGESLRERRVTLRPRKRLPLRPLLAAAAVLALVILAGSQIRARLPEPAVAPPETRTPAATEPAGTAAPDVAPTPQGTGEAGVPRADGFFTFPVEEAYSVRDLLDQARESGLLGEQEPVAFRDGAAFPAGSDIRCYLDESLLVLCWKETIDGNECSLCEVKLADAAQLVRGLSGGAYGSEGRAFATGLADAAGAVAAVNADFYAAHDFGVGVYDGQLCRFDEGDYADGLQRYNCVDTLLVDAAGDFRFFERGEQRSREEMERELAADQIRFSLCFGPILVRDGAVQQVDDYPLGEVSQGYSRAGIGQLDERHYLYLCVSHTPEAEARWTVNQFARRFGEKGVVNAYCLDGGQTAELVFRGAVFNRVDFGTERTVSDVLCFVTKKS